MLFSEKIEIQELLTELSAEASANIKGGQDQGGQEQSDENGETKFNQSKYLQALGLAYLAPPGIGEITDKEAMLAQYQGWKK
ncbi:hypothetical protein ACSQ6I_24155 [Anabaena sp. WFMT]|uniref:hypothetical protein n=1 Tax=Anabaena sp. WFMT TaxID=3449730 RepID=UPI003F269E49